LEKVHSSNTKPNKNIMKFSKLAILKVAAAFLLIEGGGGSGTKIIGVLAEGSPFPRRRPLHPEASNEVVRGA
jgi:hypothetical protein